MADEIEIPFPKKGKRITIIYEVHGGMSFNRPFDIDDTMLVWKSRAIELHNSWTFLLRVLLHFKSFCLKPLGQFVTRKKFKPFSVHGVSPLNEL